MSFQQLLLRFFAGEAALILLFGVLIVFAD